MPIGLLFSIFNTLPASSWSTFSNPVGISKQFIVPPTNHEKFILNGYCLVPYLKEASAIVSVC